MVKRITAVTELSRPSDLHKVLDYKVAGDLFLTAIVYTTSGIVYAESDWSRRTWKTVFRMVCDGRLFEKQVGRPYMRRGLMQACQNFARDVAKDRV